MNLNDITNTKPVIECSDWDALVKETYGKPYCFQQQDGCKGRGHYTLLVPSEPPEDHGHESIKEVVNGPEECVKFEVWLARDPKQPLAEGEEKPWEINLFWSRNFYPDLEVLAYDLYLKGLAEPGYYDINVDW